MTLPEALKRLNPRYLAGLIDGEGCIGLYKRGNHFRCIVAIEMTAMSIMEAMSIRYGVLLRKLVRITNSRRHTYRVDFTGEKALQLLEEVVGHLIDKQPQAEIAIKFLKHRIRTREFAWKTSPVSLELYDKMAKELKALKKRNYEDL